MGTHVLLVNGIGFRPITRSDLLVTEGRVTNVTVAIQPALELVEELEVRAASEFTQPPEVTTTSVTLNYDEIRRSPGALGDVTRLVQSLPGVVVANDQRNDIIARGGSPAENLFLVDGVEVPNLNHFAAQSTSGGPISMLNTELIDDATFLAGGLPAQHGNRLSSVLDVRLREGNRERSQTEFDMSLAGAGLIFEGPLGGGDGSWILSARQSYLGLLAGPFGLAAIPHTTNFQGKLVYDLDQRNRISFITLGGRDSIFFEVAAADLTDPSTDEIDSGGWRMVNGLVWRRLIGKRGFGTLTVSDSHSTFRTDVRDATLDFAEVFRNRSTEGETTLRYDLTYDLGGAGFPKTGVSEKLFRTDLRVDQPLGTESPFSPNPSRVNALSIARNDFEQVTGSHAQISRSLGRWVDVTGGLRFDRFGYGGFNRVGPRGGLKLHLSPTVDLTASIGRHFQQPPLVFLAADSINAELEPIRSDHYVAGLSYVPRPDLKITAEAYWKRYGDYPVSAEYPSFSLANSGDIYGVSGLLFPMVSDGT